MKSKIILPQWNNSFLKLCDITNRMKCFMEERKINLFHAKKNKCVLRGRWKQRSVFSVLFGTQRIRSVRAQCYITRQWRKIYFFVHEVQFLGIFFLKWVSRHKLIIVHTKRIKTPSTSTATLYETISSVLFISSPGFACRENLKYGFQVISSWYDDGGDDYWYEGG